MKKLGEVLRGMRKAKELRLVDIAARFEPPIDPTRVSKWETGAESPRIESLVQMARILECEVGAFFPPNACVQK